MGIAVATKNNNWNTQDYEKGVVEPYQKIQRIQQQIEEENRTATEEEMKEAIQMLLSVFKTKQISEQEQTKRFAQLFNETGTQKLFADFKVPTIS